MMFTEKIKNLRKQAQLSQEQLAEKLNVSRQAVTKWETGIGVPDIENLRAISSLFHISIDELLDNAPLMHAQEFLYQSTTEYDINCIKNYDIALEGANCIQLEGYEGEKLLVRLASDVISDIQSTFKVKLDDQKKKIDVDIKRMGTLSVSSAKESLYVLIRFPARLTGDIELDGHARTLELRNLSAESMEYTGKTTNVMIENVSGHIEINCDQDMEILCRALTGRLDVNQLSASSKLRIDKNLAFQTVVRGMGNTIRYELDGKPIADFLQKGDAAENCDTVIELNGMKSELIVSQTDFDSGEVRR